MNGVRQRVEFWQHMDRHSVMEAAVAAITRTLVDTFSGGGKLLLAGNGGSAADAQHLAAEYVGVGLPALALTVDSSVLTALGNDRGFGAVFAHQLGALASTADHLVLHTTSGRSENVLHAARCASEMGVPWTALTAGDGGALPGLAKAVADGPLARGRVYVVDTDDTALAQEAHLGIGHMVFHAVRERLGR